LHQIHLRFPGWAGNDPGLVGTWKQIHKVVVKR